MTEATAPKRHRVTIQHTGESYECPENLSVLTAMAQLGRKGIPSGCHGGGCGVCKIQVLSGEVETGVMSRSCISEDEESQGFALACRSYPASDIALKVVGKMKKAMRRRYGFV